MRDYLADLMSRSTEPNDEILDYLCSVDIPRYKKIRARLNRVRDFSVSGNSLLARQKRGQKSNLVGKLFEQLIRVILDSCQILRHDGNVRSTISEIDFRIRIEPLARMVPMFDGVGPHAIGEAKCLTTGIKTEWINELAGTLGSHSATLAILFTASPSKLLRADHRTAIAIHAARGAKIVPFGVKQLDEIAHGKNFLRLLSDQFVCAMTHTGDLHI
jgi:hypothetical protein